MSCDDVTMVSTKEQVPHTNARCTKTFRSYDQDQMLLMPPSLDDWLPDDHIALFISEIVDECLDLGAIYGSYQEAVDDKRKVHHIRVSTTPDPEQRKIFESLGIRDPLPRRAKVVAAL